MVIENRCLYMACELLNMDLRSYIDAVQQIGKPMTALLIKVGWGLLRAGCVGFDSHVGAAARASAHDDHGLQSYVYQLLDGLAHCHAHQVIHRDLKPQNLLIDREGGLLCPALGAAGASAGAHALPNQQVFGTPRP